MAKHENISISIHRYTSVVVVDTDDNCTVCPNRSGNIVLIMGVKLKFLKIDEKHVTINN